MCHAISYAFIIGTHLLLSHLLVDSAINNNNNNSSNNNIITPHPGVITLSSPANQEFRITLSIGYSLPSYQGPSVCLSGEYSFYHHDHWWNGILQVQTLKCQYSVQCLLQYFSVIYHHDHNSYKCKQFSFKITITKKKQ